MSHTEAEVARGREGGRKRRHATPAKQPQRDGNGTHGKLQRPTTRGSAEENYVSQIYYNYLKFKYISGIVQLLHSINCRR